MNVNYPVSLMVLLCLLSTNSFSKETSTPANFVMQLTRSADNFGHRRALLQLDKSLTDLGETNLKVDVVAYEDGIYALLEDNEQTSQLITKLANRGVTFKVCRLSMQSQGLTDDDFPLDVGFVQAGAPEIMRLQISGYKYLRP